MMRKGTNGFGFLSVLIYRNVHTGPTGEQRLGPIVSYYASPITFTASGPSPVKCEKAIIPVSLLTRRIEHTLLPCRTCIYPVFILQRT